MNKLFGVNAGLFSDSFLLYFNLYNLGRELFEIFLTKTMNNEKYILFYLITTVSSFVKKSFFI